MSTLNTFAMLENNASGGKRSRRKRRGKKQNNKPLEDTSTEDPSSVLMNQVIAKLGCSRDEVSRASDSLFQLGLPLDETNIIKCVMQARKEFDEKMKAKKEGSVSVPSKEAVPLQVLQVKPVNVQPVKPAPVKLNGQVSYAKQHASTEKPSSTLPVKSRNVLLVEKTVSPGAAMDSLSRVLDSQQSSSSDVFVSNTIQAVFDSVFKSGGSGVSEAKICQLLTKLLKQVSPHTPSPESTGNAARAVQKAAVALSSLSRVQATISPAELSALMGPSAIHSSLTRSQAAGLVADVIKELYTSLAPSRVVVSGTANSKLAQVESQYEEQQKSILPVFAHGTAWSPQLNLRGNLTPGDVSRLFKLRDTTNVSVDLAVTGKANARNASATRSVPVRVVPVKPTARMLQTIQVLTSGTQGTLSAIASEQERLAEQRARVESEVSARVSQNPIEAHMTEKLALEARRAQLQAELDQVERQLQQVMVQIKDLDSSVSLAAGKAQQERSALNQRDQQYLRARSMFQTQGMVLESLNEFAQAVHTAVQSNVKSDSIDAASKPTDSKWERALLESCARSLGTDVACVGLLRRRIKEDSAKLKTAQERYKTTLSLGMESLTAEAKEQVEKFQRNMKEDDATVTALLGRSNQVANYALQTVSELSSVQLGLMVDVVMALEKHLADLGLVNVVKELQAKSVVIPAAEIPEQPQKSEERASPEPAQVQKPEVEAPVPKKVEEEPVKPAKVWANPWVKPAVASASSATLSLKAIQEQELKAKKGEPAAADALNGVEPSGTEELESGSPDAAAEAPSPQETTAEPSGLEGSAADCATPPVEEATSEEAEEQPSAMEIAPETAQETAKDAENELIDEAPVSAKDIEMEPASSAAEPTSEPVKESVQEETPKSVEVSSTSNEEEGAHGDTAPMKVFNLPSAKIIAQVSEDSSAVSYYSKIVESQQTYGN